MRNLRHPPLVFWSAAAVLLMAGIVSFGARSTTDTQGSASRSASSYADRLLAETASYPSGAGTDQVRAWLEGVRDVAVEGAGDAERAGGASDMAAWADLLASVSYALENGLTPREMAERTSAVSFRIHSLAAHYRMRL